MTRLEQVMAYVDGELTAAERADFEAQAAADPALAAEIAAQQRLAARLGQAYAPVLEAEVPLRLRLAATSANDARGPRWIPWGAAAASLVAGVVAGQLLQTPPLTVGRDVPARLPVAEALDHGLAAKPGAVRIGVTFRDARGRYCRTFESTPDRLAGLACREDRRWRLETASLWSPGANRAYRTAGSETPPAVLAATDALMAGDALDASQERAARDGGWSR